ncbi:MAG TPA: hypothetical protein VHE35_28840 [Kofleriaceae bacterium]|nr:hypothetical protein [Kofleriaceae bacterium]
MRSRFVSLLAAGGGHVSQTAYEQLVAYASERGLTSGELKALLQPAAYLETDPVLAARGVRLADVKLDEGAWKIAQDLAAKFSIAPLFERLANARPAAPAPAPTPPPAPVGGTALAPIADWKVETPGAAITFTTAIGAQRQPAVVFDMPAWTDPAPKDALAPQRAAIGAATTVDAIVAAARAAITAEAGYFAVEDVQVKSKNQRYGLQDLRRFGFFTDVAKAAAGAPLPAAERARLDGALADAKEQLLCDRDYEMETGSHTNYWPYWRNYRGVLEKALAQTAPATDDFWQIKNRLEQIYDHKTVLGFRRSVDEKDAESSIGQAVVYRRPYADDDGHRVSLARGSYPTAPVYEVLSLRDGTKVYRDGDALYRDAVPRTRLTDAEAAGVTARPVKASELGLRPLRDGEPPRAGISYDWNCDGGVDITTIDIGWWGHCHNESPLNALGVDPKRGVDLYRADPAVAPAAALQHYTAEDVWDACGALASDHEGGYRARDSFQWRPVEVERSKFVGSRNDGGHWIEIELARQGSRRVRIDAEVTELWHKSDPTQVYPDPAARFRRDLPDDDGGFAPNPDWVAADVDDDDEITVDGLGRKLTMRTTFITFDAKGERYQAKEVVRLDPTVDSFVKLADEILQALPTGGGKVAEHWYNAKRGAYYQVTAEVKAGAGGGRRELARTEVVPVASVRLRQETVYDSVIDIHDFVTRNMGLPFVFDTASGLAVWNYPVDKVRIDRLRQITRTEDGAPLSYTSYRLRYTTMGGPGGDAKYIIRRDAAGNLVRAVAEDPMPDFAFRNEHWVCGPGATDEHGTAAYNASAMDDGYLLDKSGNRVVTGLWRRLAALVYASLSAGPGTEPVRVFETREGELRVFADGPSFQAAIAADRPVA